MRTTACPPHPHPHPKHKHTPGLPPTATQGDLPTSSQSPGSRSSRDSPETPVLCPLSARYPVLAPSALVTRVHALRFAPLVPRTGRLRGERRTLGPSSTALPAEDRGPKQRGHGLAAPCRASQLLAGNAGGGPEILELWGLG